MFVFFLVLRTSDDFCSFFALLKGISVRGALLILYYFRGFLSESKVFWGVFVALSPSGKGHKTLVTLLFIVFELVFACPSGIALGKKKTWHVPDAQNITKSKPVLFGILAQM